MTGEVCNCVLVHALMQKCRDEKVAKRVQVIGFRQTDFREQGFQVLAERVRMDGRAVVFCENVLWKRDATFIAESHFAVAETAQQTEHFLVHRNRPGSSILGFALLHAFAGNGAAGMLDDDIALVTAGHDHIRPAQSAQLAAPHPRADGEKVEELEDRFFITEGRQEFLHFLHRRNFLHFAFGIWQVDHARWILFDDLVALRIAENSGHDGQVFLHRLFLDRLAAVGPLAELRQQVFQCYGTQFVQLDRADLREYRFERTAVESQRSGRVFCLPIQPAAGVSFKRHFSVLAIALLE